MVTKNKMKVVNNCNVSQIFLRDYKISLRLCKRNLDSFLGSLLVDSKSIQEAPQECYAAFNRDLEEELSPQLCSYLLQVCVQFTFNGMNIFQRCTTQLKLTSRLQSNALTVLWYKFKKNNTT